MPVDTGAEFEPNPDRTITIDPLQDPDRTLLMVYLDDPRSKERIGGVAFTISTKAFPCVKPLPKDWDAYQRMLMQSEPEKPTGTLQERRQLCKRIAEELAVRIYKILDARDPERGVERPARCHECDKEIHEALPGQHHGESVWTCHRCLQDLTGLKPRKLTWPGGPK